MTATSSMRSFGSQELLLVVIDSDPDSLTGELKSESTCEHAWLEPLEPSESPYPVSTHNSSPLQVGR